MRGVPLDPRSHLLQVFMTENPPGICEVGAEIHEGVARIRCTCSNWSWETQCNHHKRVAAQIIQNGGEHYMVELASPFSPEELEKASTSPAALREFILRRTKIEYLD